MLCPSCGEENNKVIQTNQVKSEHVTTGLVERVRQCLCCGYSWTTREKPLKSYCK